MWRRLIASQLQTICCTTKLARRPSSTIAVAADRYFTWRPIATIFSRSYSSAAAANIGTKLKLGDVMPIATGHEREELEAELEGRDILEINHLVGPFGTNDEHDVVWFWLEKDKSYECPVCTQYFKLEIVGPGGPPDGHGDSDDEHHH